MLEGWTLPHISLRAGWANESNPSFKRDNSQLLKANLVSENLGDQEGVGCNLWSYACFWIPVCLIVLSHPALQLLREQLSGAVHLCSVMPFYGNMFGGGSFILMSMQASRKLGFHNLCSAYWHEACKTASSHRKVCLISLPQPLPSPWFSDHFPRLTPSRINCEQIQHIEIQI